MSQEDNCSGGWWNSIYLMIYYSLGFILSPPSSIIFAAFNLLWWWRGRSNNHTNGTRASSGWLAGWAKYPENRSGAETGSVALFPGGHPFLAQLLLFFSFSSFVCHHTFGHCCLLEQLKWHTAIISSFHDYSTPLMCCIWYWCSGPAQ